MRRARVRDAQTVAGTQRGCMEGVRDNSRAETRWIGAVRRDARREGGHLKWLASARLRLDACGMCVCNVDVFRHSWTVGICGMSVLFFVFYI
jgi:hypothetical protein